MKAYEQIAVHRPARWSQPMDVAMSEADVAWLRTREPFARMEETAFPRSTPLEGILRGDTRLHRCDPGQVIVREGDYGNSAFLVLAGEVRVALDSLNPEQLGRPPVQQESWWSVLRRSLSRSRLHEARTAEQVTSTNTARQSTPSGSSDLQDSETQPAIFLQDFPGVFKGHRSVKLGPGELFGEIAAMFRSPQTATVIASTEALLLEIRWQGLRILRRDKSFAEALDTHYRENWLTKHLREVPLLRHVPDQTLQQVADATEMRSYGRMEWNADYKRQRKLPIEEQIASEPLVCTEGAAPTELIIVRSGFGRLSQHYGVSERTTAYLGKGHLFGLDELAYNTLRPGEGASRALQQSLRAVGFLDTLQIPAETFASLVLPYVRRSELSPENAELLEQAYPLTECHGVDKTPDRRKNARQESTRRRTDRDETAKGDWKDLPSPTGQQFQPTGMLEFIVQHRLNNGNEAMVIDLHRCTRCDDCVKACAATHDGNPRFVRQGITHERLQFTQACMHCEDPVCMIGCPTGAIARSENSGIVRIHEPICVGCGVCAAACPYQNIRMVDVQDHKGRPFIDVATEKNIRKATKCDLCESSPHGPACVAACPHDALVRISLTESPPLRDWLDQRGVA